MFQVVGNSWALLLGVMLLMVGNGLQGTLLGVRGEIEGFSTLAMSLVMSAYFVGFLFGSRVTPELIRRVGHVRVFAALASFVSAVLILYPTLASPWSWTILRILIGFCFSGVYVTAESWLNNAATNDTRGQTLSVYMIVQMVGIIIAQAIFALGDPSSFVMFVIPSVLVSISFAPILLSVSPTPAFERSKAMSLRKLYEVSPLGFVGIFMMGFVFASQLGMGAIYGTQAGMSLKQISLFISAIYMGTVVLQYPVGWLSDRMDRRLLVLVMSAAAGVVALAGFLFDGDYSVALTVAFLIGGLANPLYSLLLAYTNDFLEPDDMAAAASGMLFVNGVGAILGPIVSGFFMQIFGPGGFWLAVMIPLLLMAVYAAYRMTRRPALAVSETAAYVAVMPSATAVAVEVAQEWAIEQAEEDALAEEST